MPRVVRLPEKQDPNREGKLCALAEATLDFHPVAHEIHERIADELSSFTGSDEADFVRDLVRKLVLWVGDLPASESNHHDGYFGLLQHSMEVALLATGWLSRFSGSSDWGEILPEKERLLWARALTIAALFHDIGKIYDVKYQSLRRGEVWCQGKETLAEFVARLSEERENPRFQVSFESGRGRRHETKGRALIQKILPLSISDEQCSYALAAYDSHVQRHDLGLTDTTWPLPILAMTLHAADRADCEAGLFGPVEGIRSYEDDEFLPDLN
jgi:hypothetical protein